MPYYEFMDFAKEWIEYIDAKIKRHQEDQKEAQMEKQRYESQAARMNRQSHNPPKFPK